jgi:hypothetical protein
LKIAFDENVPSAMVKVFQSFASERQLRKITGNFEIKSAADYTPRPGEPDYHSKNDVPWLKRFAADGGKVIISGDTGMKFVPHERLALVELGLVVIFFESQWSNWKFFRKCALLLHWWPVIATKIKKAKPGFWHVPCNWSEKGKLRRVSNEDSRKLKLERRQTVPKPRRRKPTKVTPPPKTSDGPLFEFVERTAKANEDKPIQDAGGDSVASKTDRE